MENFYNWKVKKQTNINTIRDAVAEWREQRKGSVNLEDRTEID